MTRKLETGRKVWYYKKVKVCTGMYTIPAQRSEVMRSFVLYSSTEKHVCSSLTPAVSHHSHAVFPRDPLGLSRFSCTEQGCGWRSGHQDIGEKKTNMKKYIWEITDQAAAFKLFLHNSELKKETPK